MIKFELGGYFFERNRRIQLPIVKKPSIDELDNYLNIFKYNSGVFILDNDQEDNNTPYKMILYSDNQHYLVMLETILQDGDLEVRTFFNQCECSKIMLILNEPYNNSLVIQDFFLVKRVFSEFFIHGDVSRELLK
ncbi:hypothetical protein A9G22_03545 [Gilliamella sp. App2-1]|uniref:DUF6911 family protein n=1 Tax=Gilliamella sp. App2-1 TaxID=3120230 RepID=UPI0008289DBF|nr:hypothetical protein [Gilliamella apicola]OCG24853.1 hypothetical protein A9G22_03545 [Gilliamella apicola]